MSVDRPASARTVPRRGPLLVLITAALALAAVTVASLRLSAPAQRPKSSVPVASKRKPVGSSRLARYVGGAACRECHPGEAALQERSGHQRTLWRAVEGSLSKWLIGQRLRDPEQADVNWSYQLTGGTLIAERSQAGRTERFPLEFGFGSGKQGVTFVTTQAMTDGGGASSSTSHAGIEHRISYFATTQSLGITPGHSQGQADEPHDDIVPQGRRLIQEKMRLCFSCHATTTSNRSTSQLETATMIANVTCERCHGPGRDHIDAVRRGESDRNAFMAQNLDEPFVQVMQCGECHRTPEMVAEERILPDNLDIVRFQPVGLSMSPCYRKGASGLKCTSCHDPHARASTDRAAYDAVCLSCHQSANQRICSVSPRAKCVDCHMPRRKISSESVFTDHWIRIPTPSSPGRTLGAGRDEKSRASAH
jgi:predicted CXXCH cytochrome family protein